MVNFKPGVKNSPIVDFSTFSSVESLFNPGPNDPWVKETVSDLTDFFIYSDNARFILPYGSEKLDPDNLPQVPSFLTTLAKRDSDVFGYEAYSTIERRSLSDSYLIPSFKAFNAWVLNNPKKFQQRCHLYRQKWVLKGHFSRVASDYVFDIEALQGLEDFHKTKKKLKLSDYDLAFAFDVALRYSLYGKLAGEKGHYLSHPIRDRVNLPTMTATKSQPPHVPIRFGPYVYETVKNLDADQYTALLHELRGVVRDRGITHLPKGEIEPEILKEIASSVGLQAQLKKGSTVAAILVGILTAIGATPTIGPLATVTGAAVSVGAVLWGGNVPKNAGRWNWVKWALEWDLEKESNYR